MIKLEKTSYDYSVPGGNVISALLGINLELKSGEYVAIIGPNGSGKTTLARLLNGLLLPSSGEVLIDGLNSKVKEDLKLIRQKVGMVFQNPENQIITTSVEREIAFGLENLNLPYEEIRERVEWAFSAFHLWEYKNSAPHSLSGGEKQRLAIASVLAMRPKYLILDEPTSLLDPEGRQMFNLLVKKLVAEGKVTIINITQFPEEALLSQRLLVLDQGKILLDNTPQKVFEEGIGLKEIGLSSTRSLEIINGLKRRGMNFKKKIKGIEDLIQELLSLQGVNYNLTINDKRAEPVKYSSSEILGDLQVEIEDLSFTYNHASINPKAALREIKLSIKQGEFIGLIGPTGSGKTTLAQLLDGLLFPTSGLLRVGGLEIKEKASYLKKIRQKVGLVFQFTEKQLFEETVYEDIAFGPRNLGLERKKSDTRVRKSLELVGLDFDAFSWRSPFSLSSGEQRRVAIAGILALEPEILILDEPTAGMDFDGIFRIKKILQELSRKGVTVVLISHNLELVAEVCKRIIYLKGGKILFDGSKAEFFRGTEELEEEKIEFPDIVKLLRSLKKAGFEIRDDLYDADGVIEELYSIFGKKYR
jgi:energy-coupling factor transporter ATPase